MCCQGKGQEPVSRQNLYLAEMRKQRPHLGEVPLFYVLLCDDQLGDLGGAQEKNTVYYTHSPWRQEAWHAGPHGKTSGWSGGKTGGGGAFWPRPFIAVFCRKDKAGQGEQLRLASLNNRGGLSYGGGL